MAVAWNPAAGVTRTGNGGYSILPENLIVDNTLSGRAEASDVTDLAHDIFINGQLEPAVAWKDPKTGFPILAAGHRRWRAIMKINEGKPDEEKRRIQFNFRPANSEKEAFEYTVRENRNRLNPSEVDDAHNVQTWQTRFGLGIKDIAKIYYPGITTDEEYKKAGLWVENMLKIDQLSDEVKEAMRSGVVSTSAALELSKIPDRMTQDKAVQKAKSEGTKLKVEDAKAARQEALGKPTKKISDNTPVKRLQMAKEIVDLAAGLAAETLSEDPNVEVLMDLARNILVKTRIFDSSILPPGFDKKAEQYQKEIEEGAVLVG